MTSLDAERDSTGKEGGIHFDHGSENSQPLKAYRSRFWILGIFSLLVWFQGLLWSTWGPISESVDAAFSGWGSSTVAMMANWGTISFVVFAVPLVWFMHAKGLRFGTLLLATCCAVGTVIRIIPLFTKSDTFFTVMCHFTAILNGIAGPLVMSAPPLLAAVWFPPRERTTATACGQLLNQLGTAGSYLEPLVVRSPSTADREEMRSDIARLMYIYAGIGVGLFIAILVYFPATPPSPPSISSSEERLNFKESFMKIIKNVQVIFLCISMNFLVAVPACWLSVLNYSLKPLGLNQDDAMWVGFLAVICPVITGLIVSRLTDLIYGHLKATIMGMIVADLALFYWFFLLTWGCIVVTKWQVYVSVVVGFSLNLSTMPLFTQLAVEKAYPCSETVVAGVLTYGIHVIGIIFFFLFFIPNIGYDWVTYVLLVTCFLPLIPLLFVQEDYNRTNVDKGKVEGHTNEHFLQDETTTTNTNEATSK